MGRGVGFLGMSVLLGQGRGLSPIILKQIVNKWNRTFRLLSHLFGFCSSLFFLFCCPTDTFCFSLSAFGAPSHLHRQKPRDLSAAAFNPFPFLVYHFRIGPKPSSITPNLNVNAQTHLRILNYHLVSSILNDLSQTHGLRRTSFIPAASSSSTYFAAFLPFFDD